MFCRAAPEGRGAVVQLAERVPVLGAGWVPREVVIAVLTAIAALIALCSIAAPIKAVEQRQLVPLADGAKPSFSLPDIDGAKQDLRSRTGRVTLVHFFATWCEPCREELASLKKLVEHMPAEDLAVVAVNVAEVPARVRTFLQNTPLNFPILFDTDRAVTRAWDVSILPTTYVLDRSLTARQFVEGDIDWQRSDILAALRLAGADAPLVKREH